MKTAEEWYKQLDTELEGDMLVSVETISKIQHDAMLEAARIVEPDPCKPLSCAHDSCIHANAITTNANKLLEGTK